MILLGYRAKSAENGVVEVVHTDTDKNIKKVMWYSIILEELK